MVETLEFKLQKAGSDKGRVDIGYGRIYERLFNPKWTRILEVGVYHGQSLKVWQEWFTEPGTIIYGIDNFSWAPPPEGLNFQIFKGDVMDGQFMSETSCTLGWLDLVIEDSLHETKGQVRVIEHFKNQINPGGLLIVEDIDPKETYENMLGGYKEWAPLRFMGLLRTPTQNLLILEGM